MSKKAKITLAAFWIILCAAFGIFSPTLPYVKEFFEIKQVNVKGTDKFTKEDIKKIFEKENWFFIDKEKIEKELKKYNFVKEVAINRLFVGNIDLIVLERKPFAILSYKKKQYLIDEDGVRLDPKYYGKKYTKNLPIIVYNDKTIKKEKLQKVDLIKEEFQDLLNIKRFYVYKSQIACKTSDNKIVVFSTKDLEKSIERAKTFIKKVGISEFSYLNFSFESMVVVRR
ncbi:FtsQ-type POTRA domain-containing protein [Persephonella sp. IF05-L8]|uniref:FtsQ-type POTRA domain-containing protein n=1 Tax=Persephonella sp. IF05-L8 TaxID=1158338 RepID=UPI000497D2DE